MTRLENIIKDIKSLEGKEVRIFGQPTVLQKNPICIDTTEILTELLDYEVTELMVDMYNEEIDEYEEKNFNSIEDYIEYIDVVDGLEEKGDNTYNYNGYLSHEVNFVVYDNKAEGTSLVKLGVHRYGDVRCNYTESCLLKFNSLCEFLEILDNMYSLEVEVEGKIFYIDRSAIMEEAIVNDEDYNHLGNIYVSSLEDAIEEIKNLL